ncbi:MAG: methyl-accepting chemotaxis protein, partial [Xanthobacteraceae bacterium]
PVAAHRRAGREPRTDFGLDGRDRFDRQKKRGKRPASEPVRRHHPGARRPQRSGGRQSRRGHGRIEESSIKISDILGVIDEIARQTNLLALSAIVESIKKVAEIVADIAAASIEQSSGIDQVNRALTQMDEVTQQNSALVEENAATAKTLEHQSQAMDSRVAYFRVDEAAKDNSTKTDAHRPAAAAAPRLRTIGATALKEDVV